MNPNTVSLALELAIQLLTRSQRISALVATAQSEGRSELTADEWETITQDADDSRAALADAIEKAAAAGR